MMNVTEYSFGFRYIILYIYFVTSFIMSKEVLEISISVEEKFDVNFNLVEGIFGLILKVFGK